jgi:hypothetical protein
MAYFDALTATAFKTTQDGRRLFFPWGTSGRGYVIVAEQDYKRLQKQMKTYIVVSLVLMMGGIVLQSYLIAFGSLIIFTAFYPVWASYLVRNLQPSQERLSLEESLISQARARSAIVLWTFEVIALVFVAFGILVLIVDPSNWLVALVPIVFSGLCAFVFARMLVLRNA